MWQLPIGMGRHEKYVHREVANHGRSAQRNHKCYIQAANALKLGIKPYNFFRF